MTAASAPPRVRDRLRDAADGPVEIVHSGEDAVYVDLDGWCVGVVGAMATRVPCALRVVDMRPVRAELAHRRPTAYLGNGMLHVGSTPLPIGRLVGAYVPPLDREVSQTDPVTVEATPPATVAGFVASHVPARGIDAAAAAGLLGRGEGLTPLGDDVLAGWLAIHRAARVATPEVDALVETARTRTTLLSATLLDCARHGEVVPEFAAWVRSLGSAGEPAAVRALHAVGGSSGAGLHAGALIALRRLRQAA